MHFEIAFFNILEAPLPLFKTKSQLMHMLWDNIQPSKVITFEKSASPLTMNCLAASILIVIDDIEVTPYLRRQ